MAKTYAILAILFCLSNVLAQDVAIKNITDENWEEFFDVVKRSNATAVLKFYKGRFRMCSFIESCHGCEHIKSHYIEAASKLVHSPDNYFMFGQVDAMKNEQLSQNFSITLLPTLVILSPLANYTAYYFDRKDPYEEILPTILTVSSADIKQVRTLDEFFSRFAFYNEALILALLKVDDTKLLSDLRTSIDEIRQEFPFAKAFYTYAVQEAETRFNIS